MQTKQNNYFIHCTKMSTNLQWHIRRTVKDCKLCKWYKLQILN